MGRRTYFTFLVYGSLVFSSLIAASGRVSGQAAVDIIVSGASLNVSKLMIDREKTLDQIITRDSFAAISTNPITFRITGLRAPEPAKIHLPDSVFSVLLVPGFRLILNGETDASGVKHWKQSGPAALLNNSFDSSFGRYWDEYSGRFIAAGTNERLQQFNKALQKNATLKEIIIKDYFNYRLMRLAIDSSSDLLALNDHHTVFQRWQSDMVNTTLKNDIETRFQSRLRGMISEQSGKPALAFSLPDSSGRLHRLTDFRGRIVYLDLWASWCVPCRLESPILQRLVNRYKENKEIVFIGIAVSDKSADWKKALRQDKPGWLQLLDKNTIVANAYAATSVPRYVLIDREGRIIDFHAPSPADYQRLIDTIEKELQH